MKFLRLSIILIFLSLFVNSCDNKKNVEKYELIKIGKSVEDYYLQKSITSDYLIKINKLVPVSYTAIKDTTASYLARVYFDGVISMTNGGSRKYDVRDTLNVYLNNDFKVLDIKQENN